MAWGVMKGRFFFQILVIKKKYENKTTFRNNFIYRFDLILFPLPDFSENIGPRGDTPPLDKCPATFCLPDLSATLRFCPAAT